MGIYSISLNRHRITPEQLKQLLRSHAWKMTKLSKYALDNVKIYGYDQQQVLNCENLIGLSVQIPV